MMHTTILIDQQVLWICLIDLAFKAVVSVAHRLETIFCLLRCVWSVSPSVT